MSRILFVLVLLIAGVGCLGFYLGWFQLDHDKIDGKSHTTITVDMDKIKADEKKALDKLRGTRTESTVPTAN